MSKSRYKLEVKMTGAHMELSVLRLVGRQIMSRREEFLRLTGLTASEQWCRIHDALIRLWRLDHRSANKDKNALRHAVERLQTQFDHERVHKRSWWKIWEPNHIVLEPGR